MKHIFVVDDGLNIRELIRKYLEKEGYRVSAFADGSTLLADLDQYRPDLLVLDIMLPGADGLALCREIRKKHELPIIFVSARDEEFDRVLGLELGGDDYLTKPFSPRELVARIKNVFRRMERGGDSASQEIAIKDLVIRPEQRYVAREGQELRLTAREFDLLEFLCRHRRISFNREQLIERIWGYDYTGEVRIVDDLVKRLRKKIAENGSCLEITTVWGYGYRIDD